MLHINLNMDVIIMTYLQGHRVSCVEMGEIQNVVSQDVNNIICSFIFKLNGCGYSTSYLIFNFLYTRQQILPFWSDSIFLLIFLRNKYF